MEAILVGAISAGSLVAALIFLRYWRTTRDRFFLFFSLSFLIEGLNRIAVYEAVGLQEDAPVYYIVRLVAYGLIIAAIVDKNRRSR